jgi:hypothetical protein
MEATAVREHGWDVLAQRIRLGSPGRQGRPAAVRAGPVPPGEATLPGEGRGGRDEERTPPVRGATRESERGRAISARSGQVDRGRPTWRRSTALGFLRKRVQIGVRCVRRRFWSFFRSGCLRFRSRNAY